MTEGPLERLTDEIIVKMDECREERKSLQQQCADLSEALTQEQLTNADMLEALELVKIIPRPWMGGKTVTWPEWDTAMEKIDAAIKSARGIS